VGGGRYYFEEVGIFIGDNIKIDFGEIWYGGCGLDSFSTV
jgi:hypothetical protein